MNNLINLGNLGAPQASPAAQGLAGQTAAPQGDSSSSFSALLMQHIGPNLSNTDNSGSTDSEQNFTSIAELARLLPGLLAQTKDSKSALPITHQTDDSNKASDDNPALAMWIASMAAMQMQPTISAPPLPPPQVNGSPLPTSIGTGQNSALQALEQQFPELVRVFSGSHFGAGKPQTGKADAIDSTDAKQTEVNTAEVAPVAVKAPEPNFASTDVKAEFEAALNAAQIADPKKPDTQPSVHANTVTQKVSAVSDKSKIDPKNQMAAATAGKENQPPQPTPVQGASAKPQTQTGDSHSNNQAKKDSAFTTQGQQSANQLNGAASNIANVSTSSTTDQSNFAAMTQAAAHNVSTNTSNHPANSAASQTVNVRDIGSVGAIDPAPRIVPTARLMEAASQAEMKVSVKSDAGNVDVRAILEGGNISATVATQHSGTRDWMMSNMHELQNSLSRDDLNLKTFEVTDSGLQNSGQGGQPKQQEQQQRSNNSTYSSFAPETHSSTESLDDIGPQETASQALSLLA